MAVLLSLVLVVKAKSAFLSAMMNNMGTAKETVNNFNKVSYLKHGYVISLISYKLHGTIMKCLKVSNKCPYV